MSEVSVGMPVDVKVAAPIKIETPASAIKPIQTGEVKSPLSTQTVGVTQSERASVQPDTPKNSPAPEASKSEPKNSAENQKTAVPPSPSSEQKPPFPDPEPNIRSNNLYERLGVRPNASPAEIRDAFRRLALKYHPDRNPQGEEDFKAINAAYEVLSKDAQRNQYDEGLQKTVSSAESADKITTEYYPQQKQKITESSYESVSGKQFATLTPDQLVAYLPATVPVIAENYYQTFVQNENPNALALITGPEAAVIQSLLRAGNESDAQKIVLQFLIMAILSAIETVAKAAAGDLHGAGEAFTTASERAQSAGEILKGLKSGKSPREIIDGLVGQIKQERSTSSTKAPAENPQKNPLRSETKPAPNTLPAPEAARETPLLPATAESTQKSLTDPGEIDALIAKEREKIAQTALIIAATRNLSPSQQVEQNTNVAINAQVQTPTPS
jgi:hypothetical protein